MEKSLYSWNMPKVPANKIYNQRGCFNIVSDHSIFRFEGTIPLESSDVFLRPLIGPAFEKALKRSMSKKQKRNLEGCYLHLGMIQVGVKPLTRQVANDSIFMCLRDARYRDFKTSLLGLAESSLKDGPIYFNCFANSVIPLSDRNLDNALMIHVASKCRDKTVEGFEPLALSYRVYSKVMSRPYGEKALKESPLGETLLYQAKIRSNNVASRVMKWDDIQIPESWLRYVEDPLQQQRRQQEKTAQMFNELLRRNRKRRSWLKALC